MNPHYQVNVTNNSIQSTTIILFQKVPNQDWFQGLSLVWNSKRVSPRSKVSFDWTRNYCFVAANTGPLMPGVEFYPDAEQEADPNGQNNAVTLDSNRGNCQFNQDQGRQPGKLYLSTSNSIPPQPQFSAGIGMSNVATVVAQARPNMNYEFSTDVEYWIATGNYVIGQVLSPNIQNAERFVFPTGIFKLNVVLNPDNTYTISV